MTVTGVLGVSRKAAATAVLLLAITALVFLIAQLAPGDPASALLGQQATPDRVAALRQEMGLDRPLVVQYLDYLAGLLRGDLGVSYQAHVGVGELIGRRLPVTAALVLCGLVLSACLSTGLAVLTAATKLTWLDPVVRALTIAAVAMPTFWVGLLLILVIALPTGVFPVGGYGDDTLGHLRGIVLPALTLAIGLVPGQLRVLRGSLTAELASDHIAATRARGIGERRVLWRHALPNAVPPALTVLFVQAGFVLFGSVVVEYTFHLPGLGSAMVTAVGQRDYPVITGITLVFAVIVVAARLVSDLLQVMLDPRIRR